MMSKKSTPKLGRLSLAILENFVKGKIGTEAAEILREDYQESETIGQALERTEDRFIHQYKDEQLAKAMFVDLKQTDRPSLKTALLHYLDHPTDPQFEMSLCEILFGEFKQVISNERIQKAIKFYLNILNQELAMLDPTFREKLVALKLIGGDLEQININEIKKRVELIIEGDYSDFNSSRQKEIIGVLAALLHIEHSQIRILQVKAGSIILDLEIPEIGANRLIDLFKSHDYRLKRLGLLAVKFEGNFYKIGNVTLPINSSLRLGKLSLTILESFAKSTLGDDFIKELRGGNNQSINFTKAVENTEKRFLSEFPDKSLSKAMFVELSQQDRPLLAKAIERFISRPTNSEFEGVLRDLVLDEFKSLPRDQVEKAVKFYLIILKEELAMSDSDFREKVAFLQTFHIPSEEKINAASYQTPPMPPQGVFGREDDLKKISDLLIPPELENEEMPPLALRGMGGIGKTTLAIAFAHLPEVQTKFKDGILWTSLGPKPTVRLLLDGWGRALGMDLQPERDEAACQNRLRQILHDRHMLIVVDDVWDTIQGNYFKVGGDHCRTLFTTRETPIANDLATRERTMRVDVLKPEAAINLLYRLSPETKTVDGEIVKRLCERLEFLPLGITLAGRMLANEADVPQRMQRLVGELVERRQARLNLLQADGRKGLDEENPVSLQAILGMSIERLSKPDQERFAMLSVFGGEPLTWEMNAVSAVWECPIEETEETISKFAQRGLVEPHGERYWMHALLADYAAEMMENMGL